MNENRPRRLKPVVVLALVFLAAVALRTALVTGTVVIHNDERHYALDGFWVKSELSCSTIWKLLIRGHGSPHVLYHPLTGEVRRHGNFPRGFNTIDDDLATFPRAGHPSLYMVMLGGIFLFFSKAWLLEADHYVLVARVLNTVLDCLTWLMLFQILRRLFGARISLLVMIPVALMPFVLVIGSIGYLDSPGTFMIVLGAWVYFLHLRRSPSVGWWILLGVLMGAGVLMKQSNVFAFPLLAALAWIWPPCRKGRALIVPLALLLLVAAGTISAGCNPRDLVTDTMRAVERTREYGANRLVRQNGFLRLEHLANPARHYHFGTTAKRRKPFTRSALLVAAHQVTFPLLLGLFSLSVAFLAARRRWRALSLPLLIVLLTVYIPFGTCVRRLYLLLPFVVLTIAMALFELTRRLRRDPVDRIADQGI